MFRPHSLSSHRIVVVSVIVITGVPATVGIWLNTVRQENERIAKEFQRRAASQAHVVREHLLVYPELMLNLATVGSFSPPGLSRDSGGKFC
jgi:hypothetical protein